eukprot:Phypoly_transcript_05131.p1 GENE.Phypoly_transcript_05131~~Phypoly_transcript_05131.p1  ORF type:complete len:332 (-),score=51.60 Phypoly_transcript_05131:94-1089(-)
MQKAKLHVLYEPPAHAADIILVHGLEGHFKDTWTNAASGFWVKWLSEDFYNVRILSYEYPNNSTFWFGGHAMPIEQRCTNFLESLYAEEVGTHTPVVFITHSMGGLLVKLALCEASRSHNSRYEQVLKNTKGVVFFATPHRGSNLAAWGSLLMKVFRASYSISALQPLAEKLLTLNSEFGELNIPSYSFGESKKLPMVGLVVEDFSAKSGLSNEVFIPVDEDHFSICKPHTRDAQTYHFTYVFLKDQFKSVLENQPDEKEIPKNIYHAPRINNHTNKNTPETLTNDQLNNNQTPERDDGMSTGTVAALAGTYLGMVAVALGMVVAVTKLRR